MTVSMHAFCGGGFAPRLRTLAGLLDAGEAHVGQARFAELAEARLAPDMLPLASQVKLACDYAADACARLAGEPPVALGEVEPSLEGLKARIGAALAMVEAVTAERLEGAERRRITLPLQAGLVLEADGLGFLRDWSLPNFHFHVAMAYAILRHRGVPLGKPDYMAHIGPLIRRVA